MHLLSEEFQSSVDFLFFYKYVIKKKILVHLDTQSKTALTLIFHLCNPSSIFRRQSGYAFITGVVNS